MYNIEKLTRHRKLPHCEYPRAIDIALHGLQPLPAELPLVSFETAQAYRSQRFNIVTASSLDTEKLLQFARVVAISFAKNDPMLRHLQIPSECPAGLLDITHKDPFGDDGFGEWTKENILFWFIRLFVFTSPFSPLEAITANDNVLKQSLVALNSEGQVVGGAFNVNIDLKQATLTMRDNDAFIKAVFPFFEPVSKATIPQLNVAINRLCKTYPAFLAALKKGKVGDINMVARSPLLPSEDTFELVAASVLHFQKLGFEYLVVSAGNQWTGAACEILGGVTAHYTPYRVAKMLDESAEPIPNKPSSKDGFISDKDSGCMVYVIRLK
jgi:hypothetical protein